MRSRLASFLLVLLPGFMFLGLLSPGAVTVNYQGSPQEYVAETLEVLPFPTRQPMIAISRATVDAAAELGALRDLLVDGSRLIANGAKRAFRVPKAEPANETIVLEDRKAAGKDLVDELFDSTATGNGEEELEAVLSSLWDKRFGKLRGPLEWNGDRMQDDFPGEVVLTAGAVPTPVAVPEPESAALVVLGLVGIGLRRARRA